MSDLSRALERTLAGEPAAPAELFVLLQEELRAIAEVHLRRERADHTLQATALVNEAWLKLADQRTVPEGGREHFLSVASRAMRRILVDHARRRGREKRGGGLERVTLSAAGLGPGVSGGQALDFLELDEALETLAGVSERQASLVELRFFGGLSEEEQARVLDVSVTTVQREWRVAKAWLAARLS